MLALTPAERRGALVLVVLLLLGAAHDLWRAAGARSHAPSDPSPAGDRTGTAEPPGPAAAILRPAAAAPRLDLNRADARELDALPGVGPVLAERIVQQRGRFGPFRDLDELLVVRGVGPRLLERLRPRLTLGAADSSPPARAPVAKPRH